MGQVWRVGGGKGGVETRGGESLRLPDNQPPASHFFLLLFSMSLNWTQVSITGLEPVPLPGERELPSSEQEGGEIEAS